MKNDIRLTRFNESKIKKTQIEAGEIPDFILNMIEVLIINVFK